MDYIQEELRRQWEALATLLLGGGAQRPPEESQEEGFPASGDFFTDSRSAGGFFAGSHSAIGLFTARPAAVEQAVAEWPAAGAAPGPVDTRRLRFPAEGSTAMEGSSPAAPGGLSGFGAVNSDEETRAPAVEGGGAVWEISGERGRGAPSPEETEGPTGGWTAEETGSPRVPWSRGTVAAERTVTELVYPAGDGAAVTAEALSRAFQRDARRYDGGFTLY